jgi:hypothetical protein
MIKKNNLLAKKATTLWSSLYTAKLFCINCVQESRKNIGQNLLFSNPAGWLQTDSLATVLDAFNNKRVEFWAPQKPQGVHKHMG